MRLRTGLRWLSAPVGACLLAAALIGPSASAASVQGPIGCQTLSVGDTGLAVSVLQGDLSQLGYYKGPVNGSFQATTRSALKAFQRRHGLTGSGALDMQTLTAIGSAMGLGPRTRYCNGVSPIVPTTGSPANTVGRTTHTLMQSVQKLASTSTVSTGGATRTFVQGTSHPTITGGLHVGGKIDGLTIVRVIHLVATGYGATAQDNYPYGATDAFGKPLRPGDVAVDPRVIALNTKMYVTGYHTSRLPQGGELAVARDTGGAIKGARIDMYINSTNESLINSFGIQSVTAYLLS